MFETRGACSPHVLNYSVLFVKTGKEARAIGAPCQRRGSGGYRAGPHATSARARTAAAAPRESATQPKASEAARDNRAARVGINRIAPCGDCAASAATAGG